MQSPGEIEDVKKKIHARARKMLYHGIANLSGPVTVEEEKLEEAGGEKRAEGRVRLLRARGTVEFRKVASGSAGILVEKRKSGISGSCIDRSRLPGRKTIGGVRKESQQ